MKINSFRDGFISNEELFTVLKMMTGDNLTDTQLQQIVNRTILYLDKDSDGLIGLDEFTQGIFIMSKLIDITLFIRIKITF